MIPGLLLSSLILLAPPAEPSARGERTLEAALLEQRETGVRLVFSSEVVRRDMRTSVVPAGSDEEERLRQLLEPHGLAAEVGAGDTWVVVRRSEAAADARPRRGRLAGQVRSERSSLPLGGVRLALREIGGESVVQRESSAPNGRFRFEQVPAGGYHLDVERDGFVPLGSVPVLVPADDVLRLGLTLRAIPALDDAIVVESSSLSLLSDDPASPLSLSRSEVAALPHLGGDVFRALSLLPGTAGSDTTARFGVRGGRSDEVLILLDGQELYDAFHLDDFDEGLSIVAPNVLSTVELTTGSFHAPHGDRMGGVLDMVTASPAEGFRRLTLSALNAQLAGGGTTRDGRGGWQASLRRGSLDLTSRIFGRENPVFWDLFGRVDRSLGDRQLLTGHLLLSDDSLDLVENVDGESKRFRTEYDSRYLWTTHQAFVGSGFSLLNRLSWTEIGRDRRGDEDEDEGSFRVLDRRDFEVHGWEAEGELAWAGEQLGRWGLGLRSYRARYDYSSETEPPLLRPSPGIEPRGTVRDFSGRVDGEHLFGFASHRFSPVPRMSTEVGGRVDRHTLTGETLFSPRLNLGWRLGEEGLLRAGWGHFHQSQRPYELEVEDGVDRFADAERSEQWVAGYEQHLPSEAFAALRLETYYRRIDDPRPRFENLFEPLNTFPEIEPDRVRIRPERARAFGLELLLEGAIGADTRWWANATWSSSEDRVAGRWVPRRRDQPWAVNLALMRRLGRWQLDLAWRYRTGWPTTAVSLEVPAVEDPGDDARAALAAEPDDDAPYLVLGPLNGERLPDRHRLDLRLSRTWSLRAGNLRFFLDVQNLYDRANVAGFDVAIEEDEEERPVLEKIPETWFGIVPSVGVTWEW